MVDATTEYDRSIFDTTEAVEQYEQWLLDTLDCQEVETIAAPQYADFDYYVYVDGYLHHYVEVKTRRHNGGRFEQEKMPIRKHAVAAFFWQTEKIKTIYLCSWNDKIAILKLWELPDSVDTMLARHDRGAGKDIYAMYDYGRFRLIKERIRPPAPSYKLQQGSYVKVY